MSILSCGALFLGPRLPRPGKGPQVTRRMFSVIFLIGERLLLLSARTSPRTHPGELEGRLCKGDWKGVLDTQLTFVLANVLAISERANAVVSIKILKVPMFNLYGLDSDISPVYYCTFTLDARDFSCAVSGFCRVYIVTRAKSLWRRGYHIFKWNIRINIVKTDDVRVLSILLLLS